MAIDERLIKALHVETVRHSEVHAEHEPHVIFQTSTIDALLEGAYDGDITFAELREHGDLGLGTLDACDGEMIALDGEFFQAAADGSVRRVGDSEGTPFALVVFFEPDAHTKIDEPLALERLQAEVESGVPSAGAFHALRIDGRFERLQLRSVPCQSKPYPPLAEVAAQQHVFDLHDAHGTIVGFRFPDYAAGLDVPGYHLHFISDDRSAGGHVLDCVIGEGELALDRTSALHLELPPGVELHSGSQSSRLIDEIERGG